MNLNQYIELEKKRLAELLASDKPVFFGARSSLAQFSRRVFTIGENPDGSSIGDYTKGDIWINPKGTEKNPFKPRNQKGFKPLKGKAGNTKFKTNPSRVRKTAYFEGWKGFREAQGLRTDFINLNYTGDLKSDIENPVDRKPTPIKIADGKYKVSIKRKENIPKYEGWKEVLKFSESEIKEFYRIAELEFRRLFTVR